MSQQEIEDLIAAAGDALERVVPNEQGNHTVAAACLSINGKLFTGINVFHFTGGPCAEPVALGTAVGLGVPPADLRLMVAVKKSRHSGKTLVINPCGRCRQQMLDLSPAIKVVVIDGDASLKVVGIEDLLPFSYIWNNKTEIEVAEA